MNTTDPEVAKAFADMEAARATLAAAEVARNERHRALRRFSYKHTLSRRGARDHWMLHDNPAYIDLIRTELAYDRALRDFRRLAMIASLTKAIDTDRRLHAAA